MRDHILVVDDDHDLVTYLSVHLEQSGFTVSVAQDAAGTYASLLQDTPDLILLDTDMPGGGGFDVLRRVATDRDTASVPLIVITAEDRLDTRVHALRSGADDFVVKPFEPEELVARIGTVLRRARQLRDLSPLTGLPGNAGITAEIDRRLLAGGAVAVLHVDIGDFKAFNDSYGFLRGDGVIAFCVACLRGSAARIASSTTFLGHIGGDDFVAVIQPDEVDAYCSETIRLWDEGIGSFYDPEDAVRGWIETEDRRGELRRFGIATLSIGVAWNEHRPLASVWEASAIAAEMKEFAKRQPGSNYQIDRRLG
jgi:DNA-binding response OmpR family regulator